MAENVVPINKTAHLGKKLKPLPSFAFAASFHLAGIMVPEFSRAAVNYPVVFLEDKNVGGMRPVVLLGLQEGENLFVDAAGKWRATYVPAIIRRYPFSLARTEQNDQFLVCIDDSAELLSDSEGQPLFNDDGTPSTLLTNAQTFLDDLHRMEMVTLEFCRHLASLELITPFNIRLEQNGQSRDVAGCHVINEERLAKLSDEAFAELKKRQYLPAIYAHLISLGQIERLMMQQAEKAAAPEKPAGKKKKAEA